MDASSNWQGLRRLHISVDIKNPTGAFLALCVVLSAQERVRGRASQAAFQMQTSHLSPRRHAAWNCNNVWTTQPLSDGIGLVQQHLSRGIWHVQYSVVFELHSTVLPVTGTFAVVAKSMFYDLGGHVDGALHYPLQDTSGLALRSSFKSFSNAYSLVRPSCFLQSCCKVASHPKCGHAVTGGQLRVIPGPAPQQPAHHLRRCICRPRGARSDCASECCVEHSSSFHR